MFPDVSARLRAPLYMLLYWVVFLLALEPGNVLHARHMGFSLHFDVEALRIGVASLLGCSSAPLLITLARRFPISAARLGRSLAIHAAGVGGIAFALIVVSCFLAAWMLMAKPLPSVSEIRDQLAANWLLLAFALAVFALLCHALDRFAMRSPKAIPIKTRGRLAHLDVASIEWIESQGNYLALHAGGKSHLIRETMKDFEARLDATRFMRVHRRAMVDVHRVREIQPLANGDSLLTMRDGQTIRASRGYRAALMTRWREVMARS